MPRVSRRGENMTSPRRKLSTTVYITVVETTRRGGLYTSPRRYPTINSRRGDVQPLPRRCLFAAAGNRFRRGAKLTERMLI